MHRDLYQFYVIVQLNQQANTVLNICKVLRL